MNLNLSVVCVALFASAITFAQNPGDHAGGINVKGNTVSQNPGTGENADEAEIARRRAAEIAGDHERWIGWSKLIAEYDIIEEEYKPFPNMPEPLRGALLDPNPARKIEEILDKQVKANEEQIKKLGADPETYKKNLRASIGEQYRAAVREITGKVGFMKLRHIQANFDRAKMQDHFRAILKDRKSFTTASLKRVIEEVTPKVVGENMEIVYPAKWVKKLDSIDRPGNQEEHAERVLLDMLEKARETSE